MNVMVFPSLVNYHNNDYIHQIQIHAFLTLNLQMLLYHIQFALLRVNYMLLLKLMYHLFCIVPILYHIYKHYDKLIQLHLNHLYETNLANISVLLYQQHYFLSVPQHFYHGYFLHILFRI